MNFWEDLKKPIYVLAPMYGVTDTVFRQIVTSVGKPTVFFTEFTPVEGLMSPAKQKMLEALRFTEEERPIVAQIWGSKPEKFYGAAKLISTLGFDGIDINMGCPEKNPIKTGSCAALIKNPALAIKIIEATIKGANGLPVSVKTRIGFGKIETDEWVRILLSIPIAALTLHLRTAKEMSKVPAHWEEMKKAVEIRQELGSKTLLIGNGDVKSLKEAIEKCDQYGIDGIMIGRGIFENVWLFNPEINPEKITPQQKIDLLLKHLELFQKTYGNHEQALSSHSLRNRHFEVMKKFVKCYVNNFKGATEAREKLMSTKSLDELIYSVTKLTHTSF